MLAGKGNKVYTKWLFEWKGKLDLVHQLDNMHVYVNNKHDIWSEKYN